MDYSNTYSFYEKKANSVHNRRCIDGKVTGCGNCVGYCRYEMHPGFLTKALRKEHNCIKKVCYYYVAKPRKKDVVCDVNYKEFYERWKHLIIGGGED